MSGIQVGTRLEQLEALQTRTGHELAAARRREGSGVECGRLEDLLARIRREIEAECPRPPKPARRVVGSSVELQLLERLGVSAREVKEWAVDQGLIEVVARGRIKMALVEAYAAAHPAPEPV